MYKYLFILVVISLVFFIKIFSQNNSVSSGNELIHLIRQETGGSNILLINKIKRDTGNQELNKLNIGYYVMFEKTQGERTLTLLENNTVKFTYSLNEKQTLSEVGFWKTQDDGKIEIIIVGNQYGLYDESRNFIFVVNSYEKKIISDNYDKLIYGSGGFVFYKK